MDFAIEAQRRGWFPLGQGESAGMARFNGDSKTVDVAANCMEAVEGLFAHISFSEMGKLAEAWANYGDMPLAEFLPEPQQGQTGRLWQHNIAYYPASGTMGDKFEITDLDGEMVSIPGWIARQYADIILPTGKA